LISIRIDRARAFGAGEGWHFRQVPPRHFEGIFEVARQRADSDFV